jgi:hypothetical protein
MGNFIANVFGWIWSNFIGWPRESSPITGFLRICLFSFILSFATVTLPLWLGLYCLLSLIIGLFQFGGVHSINGPFDFKLNKQLKEGIRDGSITVVNPRDYSFDKEYPGLSWWFRVRNHHMSTLSNSEKAKFFVETGGLTEGSVKDLMKYPHTKRAIQRLDFECRKPAKELIEYMRGVKRI